MTSSSDDLFFTRTGLDRDRVSALVGDTLKGADDGELFLDCALYTSAAADQSIRLKPRSPSSI